MSSHDLGTDRDVTMLVDEKGAPGSLPGFHDLSTDLSTDLTETDFSTGRVSPFDRKSPALSDKASPSIPSIPVNGSAGVTAAGGTDTKSVGSHDPMSAFASQHHAPDTMADSDMAADSSDTAADSRFDRVLGGGASPDLTAQLVESGGDFSGDDAAVLAGNQTNPFEDDDFSMGAVHGRHTSHWQAQHKDDDLEEEVARRSSVTAREQGLNNLHNLLLLASPPGTDDDDGDAEDQGKYGFVGGTTVTALPITASPVVAPPGRTVRATTLRETQPPPSSPAPTQQVPPPPPGTAPPVVAPPVVAPPVVAVDTIERTVSPVADALGPLDESMC